ncbi:MAG: cupin domain-containing protein [Anaerolineales bacterium]|nr:cupin domain-containing protein [Anaerolineales bacterium]
MIKTVNVRSQARAMDGKSFAAMLQKMENNVVRDPYVLFDWGDSQGGHFQAGYSVLYPGCRTGGHGHEDLEEVYHVISGYGIMHIGEDAFEIGPGDSWLVPLKQPHWTENPGNLPLEMFWFVIKV